MLKHLEMTMLEILGRFLCIQSWFSLQGLRSSQVTKLHAIFVYNNHFFPP